MPVWLVVVALGGAGVLGYLLFFRNSSSSSGNTGTTGYSSQGLAVMQNPDESATMSLQNQELSLLANQLAEQGTSLSGQISDVGGSVANYGNQIYQQALAANQGTTALQGQLAADTSSIESQASGVYTALGSQIGNLQNSQNANANANLAYYQSLYNSLVNYANSLSSQVAAGDQQANTQLQQVQSSINQLGAFSGWQFYQIPNRYQALIPAGLNPPGWNG